MTLSTVSTDPIKDAEHECRIFMPKKNSCVFCWEFPISFCNNKAMAPKASVLKYYHVALSLHSTCTRDKIWSKIWNQQSQLSLCQIYPYDWCLEQQLWWPHRPPWPQNDFRGQIWHQKSTHGHQWPITPCLSSLWIPLRPKWHARGQMAPPDQPLKYWKSV